MNVYTIEDLIYIIYISFTEVGKPGRSHRIHAPELGSSNLPLCIPKVILW